MVGGVEAAIVDVARVGLPVMALLIAGESMGLPLPGETALITAAILASRGKLDIVPVIVLAATAASVGGVDRRPRLRPRPLRRADPQDRGRGGGRRDRAGRRCRLHVVARAAPEPAPRVAALSALAALDGGLLGVAADRDRDLARLALL